ncbi:hypothetical protein D6D20_04048 [Aureobasidium pullulans]|uniref:Uncharacterized protein n=1 Tax=Aureobasidium pullulans TaxID=5580 RepID=A0A4V4L3H5_AURPU|nr:hypothetical protein D6D25_04893 [Aureobasidium pullulans]THW62891.1 hypothetical protein D6D20_04048 [Aureobasidium pullulans]THZ92936.1 hypothetical protein D6C82_09151 [Aureobasidium pullulans]
MADHELDNYNLAAALEHQLGLGPPYFYKRDEDGNIVQSLIPPPPRALSMTLAIEPVDMSMNALRQLMKELELPESAALEPPAGVFSSPLSSAPASTDGMDIPPSSPSRPRSRSPPSEDQQPPPKRLLRTRPVLPAALDPAAAAAPAPAPGDVEATTNLDQKLQELVKPPPPPPSKDAAAAPPTFFFLWQNRDDVSPDTLATQKLLAKLISTLVCPLVCDDHQHRQKLLLHFKGEPNITIPESDEFKKAIDSKDIVLCAWSPLGLGLKSKPIEKLLTVALDEGCKIRLLFWTMNFEPYSAFEATQFTNHFVALSQGKRGYKLEMPMIGAEEAADIWTSLEGLLHAFRHGGLSAAGANPVTHGDFAITVDQLEMLQSELTHVTHQ